MKIQLIRCIPVALLVLLARSVFAQSSPVIDVHLHAYVEVSPGMSALWTGEPEAQALPGASNAEEHMLNTLAEMDRHNVVLAVVSGPEEAVRAWQAAAPDRFIGGAVLNKDGMPEHSVDAFRDLVKEGVFGVLGELGLQYYGISPDNTDLEPYYAALEEMGVPLALHTGLGPPGAPHSFAPDFRVTLGRPTLLEPVLVRHPDLKVYIMHAGWPYLTETVAMMYIYPKLYADIGVLAWALPTAAFYDALQKLVNAGFGDRLLFGTDQIFWPGALGLAIEKVKDAPFLTDQQKRDILYNNAACFLGLSEEQIAKHHEDH